ncbi:MAG: sugar phosphate isomerase/epimerase [Clostridia bacterium]|nr:sugar phosphate isomerase/epimerase [Clostridia bacterium]
MKFGLNLYSLRNQIATPEAFIETATALREMGYSYLQFSGGPLNAEVVKRVVDTTGLPVVLTHVPFERILDDTENLVREHRLFDCLNVGLGSMRYRGMSDAEIMETIGKLEEAGKRLNALGAKFFYHHHDYEFCKMTNGKTIFDCILENTEHVNITLDTHWLQAGGVSITEYIAKAAQRLECVHLKDYIPAYNEENKLVRVFAPVGEGNINWRDVIDAMKRAGVKNYLVEQDNASILPDPLGQVGSSIRYLNENFGAE